MSKENKSKYAILGVLSYGPMSGYDIKKFIQQSISNFWNESYGQIYPILKQLTAEGLASSHTEKQEGKPERYMYTLTGKGWEALQQWLTEPSEHLVGRIEILLKLFFGRHTPVSTSIEHVQRFRTLQVQLLHKYAEIEKHINASCSDETERLYLLMTVSYGLHESQALVAWCDETLAALSTLAEKEQIVKTTQKGDITHG
jgi:PadR family transcriptional regulator, regulatory protein AphA